MKNYARPAVALIALALFSERAMAIPPPKTSDDCFKIRLEILKQGNDKKLFLDPTKRGEWANLSREANLACSDGKFVEAAAFLDQLKAMADSHVKLSDDEQRKRSLQHHAEMQARHKNESSRRIAPPIALHELTDPNKMPATKEECHHRFQSLIDGARAKGIPRKASGDLEALGPKIEAACDQGNFKEAADMMAKVAKFAHGYQEQLSDSQKAARAELAKHRADQKSVSQQEAPPLAPKK